MGKDIGFEIDQAQKDLARKMGLTPDELRARYAGQQRSDSGSRVTMTGESGSWGSDKGVSEVALARQDKSDAIMRRAGILVEDTAVTRGARVVSSGVQKFDTAYSEFERLPLAADALREVGAAIDAEKRTPVPFDVRNLRLDLRADGTILMRRHGATGKNGEPKAGIPVNYRTIAAFCEYNPDVFAKLKPALTTDPEEGGLDIEDKIEFFNRFVVDRLAKKTFRRGSESKLLWVRQQGDKAAGTDRWQTFTITGTRHTSKDLDGAVFARMMADGLDDSGLRGEVEYNPATGSVKFNAYDMPNHVVDLAAGDVFKAGISGSTNDMNGGSFEVWNSVLRNLCLNLIILQDGKGRLARFTHSASAAKVRRGLQSGLANGGQMVTEFQKLWGNLRSTKVEVHNDEGEQLSTHDVIRGLASEVKLAGVKRDAIVEAMLSGYAEEPGDTWADVVNAVTRAHFMADLDAFQLAQESGRLLPIIAKRAADQG
jgi:hypothetical protein